MDEVVEQEMPGLDARSVVLDARLRLLDEWVEGERALAARQARQAELLCRRLDLLAREPDFDAGGDVSLRSLAAEYAAAAHIPPSTAAVRLTDAWALVHQFPGVLASLAAGRITKQHADVILNEAPSAIRGDAADRDRVRGEYEREVLGFAEQDTAARTRAHARGVATRLAPDEMMAAHTKARARRRVTVTPDGDGMAVLTALLPEILAHAIKDRLDAQARHLKKQAAAAKAAAEPVPEPFDLPDLPDGVYQDFLDDLADAEGASVGGPGGDASPAGDAWTDARDAGDRAPWESAPPCDCDADAEPSDAGPSDMEPSDMEPSDMEPSDAERSDATGSDATGSDASGSDATDGAGDRGADVDRAAARTDGAGDAADDDHATGFPAGADADDLLIDLDDLGRFDAATAAFWAAFTDPGPAPTPGSGDSGAADPWSADPGSHVTDADVPPRDGEFEAIVAELLATGLPEDPAPPDPSRRYVLQSDSPENGIGVLADDDRTMDQLRADLLCDLLLTAAPGTAPDGALRTALGSIQARVQVTVRATTLAGADELPAELDGTGPLEPDWPRTLAGLAPSLDRLFLDSRGMVAATDSYTPTSNMKRFLRARDQHCRFPGCRRPPQDCQIDHNEDHARGGPTALSNLALFCTGHHPIKHPDLFDDDRWTARQLPGGIIEWTSPLGRTYTDHPAPRVMFV